MADMNNFEKLKTATVDEFAKWLTELHKEVQKQAFEAVTDKIKEYIIKPEESQFEEWEDKSHLKGYKQNKRCSKCGRPIPDKNKSGICCVCSLGRDLSGANNPFYGKTHTEKAKQKMSESAKQRIGDKNQFFGRHHSVLVPWHYL